MSRQTYYYSTRLENMQLKSSSYVCWEWNRRVGWNTAVWALGYIYREERERARGRQMMGLLSWLPFWCQFQTSSRAWMILIVQFSVNVRKKVNTFTHNSICLSPTHPDASSLNLNIHTFTHTYIDLRAKWWCNHKPT